MEETVAMVVEMEEAMEAVVVMVVVEGMAEAEVIHRIHISVIMVSNALHFG